MPAHRATVATSATPPGRRRFMGFMGLMRFMRFMRFTTVACLLAGSIAGAAAQGADATDPRGAWLTPALTYDGDVLGNLRGGARTGSTSVGNLHLRLTARGDSIGWVGTSAFLDVLTIHGGHPSRLVGDAQGVSNIEGPAGTQIEELWLQHNFKGSSASLLAGIYDVNSEFYRLKAAGLFLNSAFGIGPEFAQSGVEGPSIFPRTSAGVRVEFKPAADTVVRAALMDGVPMVRPDGSRAIFRDGDGLLAVTEVALLTRMAATDSAHRNARERIGRLSALPAYDDKLALGLWHYSGRLADLSDTQPAGGPVLRSGTSGAYLIGERLLVGRDGAPGRRLSAFAQIGYADPRTNRFASYVGAGLVASGRGLGGGSDELGVSIAHATNGSHYARAWRAQTSNLSDAETTIEVTYLSQLSKHLSIQPDVQYVMHPNTRRSVPNAWVAQLRFEIAF